MALSSLVIELSVTPFAFYAIIMLLHCGLDQSLCSLSLGIIIRGTIRSHSCSKHFTLRFPLGCLGHTAHWFLSSCSSLFGRCLLLVIWRLIVWVFHLLHDGFFTNFFHIEHFSLLHENFLANLGVLYECLLCEFASASIALNTIVIPATTSVIIGILIISGIFVKRQQLFLLLLFRQNRFFFLFIVVSMLYVALLFSSNRILCLLLGLRIWIPAIIIIMLIVILIEIPLLISSILRNVGVIDSMWIRIKAIVTPSWIVLFEATCIVIVHLLLFWLRICVLRVSSKNDVIDMV